MDDWIGGEQEPLKAALNKFFWEVNEATDHTTLLDRFKWKWFTRNYRFYFRSFSLFLAAFYILQLSNRKQIFFRVGDRAQCLTTAFGGEKESKFLPVANRNKMLDSKWFSGDKNAVGWCRLVRGRIIQSIDEHYFNPQSPWTWNWSNNQKTYFRASDERHCGSCLTFNRRWINLGSWLAFVGLQLTRKMKVDIESLPFNKEFN